MNAHGVDVFDEADGDFLAFGIAHDFEFEFFPAFDGFFDQNLADEACGKSAADHHPEFLEVVDQTAAGSAHGVGRPDDAGQIDSLQDVFGFFKAQGNFASGHFDAQLRHRVFECLPVLSALDGIRFDSDDLDSVFFQNSLFGELRGEVQSGLAAKVRQQGIGPFLRDDFFDAILTFSGSM